MLVYTSIKQAWTYHSMEHVPCAVPGAIQNVLDCTQKDLPFSQTKEKKVLSFSLSFGLLTVGCPTLQHDAVGWWTLGQVPTTRPS